jgi:hypothetical protein
MPGATPSLTDLDARIARLRTTVIVLALAVAGLLAWQVTGRSPRVLVAERLDIVEPDGTLSLVLSNSRRVPVATIDGEVLLGDQAAERMDPAIIFFDGKGTEVGGMLFGTRETEDGYTAIRHLSLDAYRQDQTVVLSHRQTPQGAVAGLTVWDRPWDKPLPDALRALGLEMGATRAEMQQAIQALPEEDRDARLRALFGVQRVFLGSNAADDATLVLHDGQGRPRVRIVVPLEAEPYLAILDADGNAVARLGAAPDAR